MNATEMFRIKLLTKMTTQIAMANVTSGKIDPMILNVISQLLETLIQISH